VNIKFKSIYNIKRESKDVEKKSIPDDFEDYIKDFFEFVENNETNREYKIKSNSSLVVDCVNNAIQDTFINNNIDNLQEYAQKIAEKLLEEEIKIQDRVKHLSNVKKGSLLQIIIQDNTDFEYLIAKVEHNRYFDQADFSAHEGFSADQKKIWKTCSFKYRTIDENNIVISEIKIYVDTGAKYWADSFLELDALTTDEENTKKAFQSIDKTLTKKIKYKSGIDYSIIRNNFVGYLRKPESIDYDSMIDHILEDYEAVNLDEHELKDLISSLKLLPDQKKFDRQFNSVPSQIRTRIRKVYKVNAGIEMRIQGHINDFDRTIVAGYDERGSRYIRIQTDDDETFNDFYRKQ
jgi:hypothetical protein